MRIPGPDHEEDGGLRAVAAAGGLHRYPLRLHDTYGPVVRFQLPGVGEAVSVADPVLLEATAHIDKRPAKLFAFLDPLCEAGNLQVLPADEHTPWRRLLLSVLAGRPAHERHFARFTDLATELADRWAAHAGDEPLELQKELTALSLRMICEFALGGADAGTDADRVVTAFEEVLTEHLGRLYQVPRADPRSAQRADAALARLRATVDRVVAAHRPDGRTGRSDLIGALVEAGQSPARIRDTVMVTLLAATTPPASPSPGPCTCWAATRTWPTGSPPNWTRSSATAPRPATATCDGSRISTWCSKSRCACSHPARTARARRRKTSPWARTRSPPGRPCSTPSGPYT